VERCRISWARTGVKRGEKVEKCCIPGASPKKKMNLTNLMNLMTMMMLMMTLTTETMMM
jgi:hypothetical protein